MMNSLFVNTNITNSVGFGTAALGDQCHNVVLMALEAGFRYFDTAEENQYWYNSKAVASALRVFHQQLPKLQSDHATQSTIRKTTTADTTTTVMDHEVMNDDECVMIADDETNPDGLPTCLVNRPEEAAQILLLSPQQRFCYEIRVSTKIPPWELISADHIRNNAKRSRMELMSFCDDFDDHDAVTGTTTTTRRDNTDDTNHSTKMPLDIYYIHAPACWKGWHTKCDHPPDNLLNLRSVWLAMEAVVGTDRSARRIGLSNVRPDELLDIVQFVQERQKEYHPNDSISGVAPPRLPDVVQSFADPIEPATEIRQICAKYHIEFVSYSTLGTQHVYRSTNPSPRTNPVLTHATVRQLAERYQRSTAEIVLSWAIQHGMSVIPRSSQKIHIEQLARLLPNPTNRHAGPMGFLSADDLAQIDLMKE